MILLTTRSTRTDTLFPYTTLFRSTTSSTCWASHLRRWSSSATSSSCWWFPRRNTGRSSPKNSTDGAAAALQGDNDNGLLELRRVGGVDRSEEHTSELQSLMRISYAVFCLKKKNKQQHKQKRI